MFTPQKLNQFWLKHLLTPTKIVHLFDAAQQAGISIPATVYSQSAENRVKFFINFYQRVQISGKYRRSLQDPTNSL